MAKAKYSLRDNSRELGRAEFHIPDITVDSIGQILTDFGAFRTAIDGITLGVMAKEALVMDETNLSALAPTDPQAQKGIKWTVQYTDNQQYFDPPVNAIPNAGYQQIFTNTIPTANLALLPNGSEELNLAAGPGLAFATAFNAIVRSPYGGTTTLLRVYYSD